MLEDYTNPLNPQPGQPAPSIPVYRKKRATFRDKTLLNLGLKCCLGLVVVLIFLTAVQCTLKKPESPTWTTQLVVPMVNRTYLMPEIIDRIDQPNIYYDSTGAEDQVVFRYSEDIDTIEVTDNLSTPDISHSGGSALGEVTIFPDNPNPVSISLGDVITLRLDFSAPDTSFDMARDIDPIGSFSTATIASGGFDFAFTNDFGLDLDTVIFKLYDITFADTVAYDTLPDPGLPAGESETVFIDLSGQTISDDLRMIIHCHTPGAPPTFSVDDKSLETAVSSDSLVVTSAVTEVPALTRDFQEAVALDDSNTIHQAVLDNGQLSLSIRNETALQTEFTITLNDFNAAGNPLEIIRSVGPNSTVIADIDLTGYIFEPGDQTYPQNVAIDVQAAIDASSPNLVAVSQYDSLLITADISGLNFSSMMGVIQPTDAAFDDIALEIEVPKGFDSLQLVEAILDLNIDNGIGFPGNLDLTITGDNGKSLNITGLIAAGDPDSPVRTVIQEPDLSDFLFPMPSNITINGTATFGDGVTVGTVTAADFVFSNIYINSPLRVIIPDSTMIEADIEEEEIDQEDIDLITDHVVEAGFNTIVTNHLPLGITVEMYLDGDSTRLNSAQAQLVVGPITVAAGTVDAGGIVTAATISENLIVLDSLEIKILENDTLYIGQSVMLNGTGGQAVSITPEDFYNVVGTIEVEYIFDGEF